jgi:hypothetical protein
MVAQRACCFVAGAEIGGLRLRPGPVWDHLRPLPAPGGDGRVDGSGGDERGKAAAAGLVRRVRLGHDFGRAPHHGQWSCGRWRWLCVAVLLVAREGGKCVRSRSCCSGAVDRVAALACRVLDRQCRGRTRSTTCNSTTLLLFTRSGPSSPPTATLTSLRCTTNAPSLTLRSVPLPRWCVIASRSCWSARAATRAAECTRRSAAAAAALAARRCPRPRFKRR